MEKATHEAKQRTSWITPNKEYDDAVRQFVVAALSGSPKNRFLTELRDFHSQVINWGLFTAISQLFLKLASPGVPDIYQGQELWDFSLVDPDNRREVDFAQRRELLQRMQQELGASGSSRLDYARRLANTPSDPNLKLFVTSKLLHFRRRNADLFRQGQYIPLAAVGSKSEHAFAFAWRLTTPARSVSEGEPLKNAHSPGTSNASEKLAIAIAPRYWQSSRIPAPTAKPPPPRLANPSGPTHTSTSATCQTRRSKISSPAKRSKSPIQHFPSPPLWPISQSPCGQMSNSMGIDGSI